MAAERPFQDSPAPQAASAAVEEVLPFPEYLTCQDRSQQLAEDVVGWLTDEQSHQSSVSRLRELSEQFAHAGATRRAADFILAKLFDQPDRKQAA